MNRNIVAASNNKQYGAYLETITSSWVGQDDVTALLCLDFLRRMKVGVPQEISVAGFDDSPRASLKGLTSFNFGSQAVIHAMMQYILDIKTPFTTRRNMAVELDGFVNVRSTTGPASAARTAAPVALHMKRSKYIAW